jgi:hypothetical protein
MIGHVRGESVFSAPGQALPGSDGLAALRVGDVTGRLP